MEEMKRTGYKVPEDRILTKIQNLVVVKHDVSKIKWKMINTVWFLRPHHSEHSIPKEVKHGKYIVYLI